MRPLEVLNEKTKIVKCLGIEESPHPLVYLDVHKTGHAVCPYCNRAFVIRGKENLILKKNG